MSELSNQEKIEELKRALKELENNKMSYHSALQKRMAEIKEEILVLEGQK